MACYSFINCDSIAAMLKYVINEKVIPKMFASKPKGSETSSIIKTNVSEPPVSIALKAPNLLGVFVNKATSTGINIPETIKE